jgi:hypothetical protein
VLAADQPGASGVATSADGRYLAFTSTVTNPDTFENSASARLPPLVERTAYLTAADVIDQAASARSDELTIAVEAADGDLVVEIGGIDVGATTPLSDRIGALGGQIIRTSAGLRVTIPCG